MRHLPERLRDRLRKPSLTDRRARSRGQGLAEFTLVIPILMVLAVAVGDFGRVFSAMVAVESAAREAADYAGYLGSAAWSPAQAPWTTNERRASNCASTSAITGTTYAE